MIPTATDVNIIGELPGESRRMEIDPQSISHILRILIDLYSDPELAVIRELSTNAIDSHIMAGVKRPIEVTTPAPLSPFLKIKDFGLGMSVTEVFELWGRYGASTKRATNDATGMLGLGSKSPLTYTNQFTLIAVKDGVQATVSISRDEDGVGNLTVVDTAAVAAPNGVEITVPAKSRNKLSQKAKEFFRHWRTGTVLLNGENPTGLGDEAIWVTNEIALIKHDRYSDQSSLVVMGNVPYPAPTLAGHALNLPPGHSIVAHVPIGAVEFAPSREGLQDTKQTRETLVAVKAAFTAGLQAAIQREIGGAPTAIEALKAVRAWGTLSAGKDFTWHGRALPREIRTPSAPGKDRYGYNATQLTAITLQTERWSPSAWRRTKSITQSTPVLSADVLINAIFITDFNGAAVTPTLRKKATQWLDRQPAEVAARRYFVFLDWKPDFLDLMDKGTVVAFATIKADKLPKTAPAPGATGRIPGSFDLVWGGKLSRYSDQVTTKAGVPGDDIDLSHPVFYVHGNTRQGAWNHAPLLAPFHKAFTIICLPENRLAKFRRDNPQISSVPDEIKKQADLLVKRLTADEKLAFSQQRAQLRATFAALAPHAAKIKDPAIQEAIRLSGVKIDAIRVAYDQTRGYVDLLAGVQFKNPLSSYLLWNASAFQRNPQHVIRYLNNEYQQKGTK